MPLCPPLVGIGAVVMWDELADEISEDFGGEIADEIGDEEDDPKSLTGTVLVKSSVFVCVSKWQPE